jgi:hypothetical protein
MTATMTHPALTQLEQGGVRCTIAREGLKFDIPKNKRTELSPLVEKLATEHRRELVAALNWRSLTQAIGDLEKLATLHRLFELRLLEITVAEPVKEMKGTLARHQEAGNTPVRLLLDGKQLWAAPNALPDSEPERSRYARRFYDEQIKSLPSGENKQRFIELLADVANALTEWGLEDLDETLLETRGKLQAALAKSGVAAVRANLLGQWRALDAECVDLAAANNWWKPDDGKPARIKVPELTEEAKALARRKAYCAWALYYCEQHSGEVDSRVWLEGLGL